MLHFIQGRIQSLVRKDVGVSGLKKKIGLWLEHMWGSLIKKNWSLLRKKMGVVDQTNQFLARKYVGVFDQRKAWALVRNFVGDFGQKILGLCLEKMWGSLIKKHGLCLEDLLGSLITKTWSLVRKYVGVFDQ